MHPVVRSLRYCVIAAAFFVSGCQSENAEDVTPAVSSEPVQSQLQLTNPEYLQKPVKGRCCVIVAHAGGGIDGNAYTNSLEAIEATYALGVRMIELDFEKTADGHWIATHDWPWWKKNTAYTGAVPPDFATFSKQTLKIKQNGWSIAGEYATVSLQWVNDFLIEHKDAVIVTDIKELKLFPEFVAKIRSLPSRTQFIFQAYSFKDIDLIVKQDASARIILTLYRMGRPPALYKGIAARREKLVGVTLPMNWAYDPATLESLKEIDVPLYLHGSPANINSRGLHAYFAEKGVSGFYLD
jgi:glycerophosphoryl diester phosphodiesterase